MMAEQRTESPIQTAKAIDGTDLYLLEKNLGELSKSIWALRDVAEKTRDELNGYGRTKEAADAEAHEAANRVRDAATWVKDMTGVVQQTNSEVWGIKEIVGTTSKKVGQ